MSLLGAGRNKWLICKQNAILQLNLLFQQKEKFFLSYIAKSVKPYCRESVKPVYRKVCKLSSVVKYHLLTLANPTAMFSVCNGNDLMQQLH